jgi:hypothetical protein
MLSRRSPREDIVPPAVDRSGAPFLAVDLDIDRCRVAVQPFVDSSDRLRQSVTAGSRYHSSHGRSDTAQRRPGAFLSRWAGQLEVVDDAGTVRARTGWGIKLEGVVDPRGAATAPDPRRRARGVPNWDKADLSAEG